MVSSIGATRMPRCAMTARSYLPFWVTLRTAGFSSSVFRRARAVGLSIWVRARAVRLAAEVEAAGVGRGRVLVRQGDVAGVVGADGQRHAAQAGVGGGQGVGLGVEADDAGFGGAGDPGSSSSRVWTQV
jgi:hypothetical protein